MSNSDMRIPDEIAPEVLALASRYYEDYRQSFSAADLVAAGAEVQIPEAFIQKAIQAVQAQHLAQQVQQQRVQRRRRWVAMVGVGCGVAIALWSIWTYNTFAYTANRVDAAWAQVDNQLQRRADLLPNLVSVTQAYANHEQTLVTTLTQARESYLRAATPPEKAVAIEQVNRAIQQFYDYAAGQPELKSNQLFVSLQYEIAGTENRLAVERMRYNQAVEKYNQTIRVFPNSLLARIFNVSDKPFFKATNSATPILPEP